MTKKEVLEAAARGEGCLGKCADDEPVFVLCGRDILAVSTIQYWMHRLQMMTRKSTEKIERANADVQLFLAWAGKNGTRVPD